jgi:hypothetical protein
MRSTAQPEDRHELGALHRVPRPGGGDSLVQPGREHPTHLLGGPRSGGGLPLLRSCA